MNKDSKPETAHVKTDATTTTITSATAPIASTGLGGGPAVPNPPMKEKETSKTGMKENMAEGEEAPTVEPPQSYPGPESGPVTGASVQDWEEIPLLERLLKEKRPLLAGKKAKRKLRAKGSSKKQRHGKRGVTAPRARLRGLFRRVSKGSRSAEPVEWRPEPPLSDSPNLAFTQTSAETAMLSTLRGRAHYLDALGSPFPMRAS